MAVSQVGPGGLSNVKLYGQNQAKTTMPEQGGGHKSETVGAGESFTVDLSLESARLSKQVKDNGGEDKRELQTQRLDEQKVPQAGGSDQTNGVNDRQQEKIDLFV